MNIPEGLQDNWLLVLLAVLFIGPQAIFAKGNIENMWLFGWLYRKVKNRRLETFEQEQRLGTALRTALQDEINGLSRQLARQNEEAEETERIRSQQIRELRRENMNLLAYTAMLKRWVADVVSDLEGASLEGHPMPPDFEDWVEQRRG